MSDSIREISEHQAQAGTTIDGDRLDRLGRDLVGAINDVKPRNVQRRFTQSQIVQHLFPAHVHCSTYRQDGPPFMSAVNSTNTSQSIAPHLDGGYLNEYRHKGVENPNAPMNNGGSAADGMFSWTNTMYMRDPVILHGFSARLHTNNTSYLNEFKYLGDAANLIVPKTSGDPVDDFYLCISIDNPFSTESAALQDPEVKKLYYRIDASRMGSTPENGLGSIVNDQTPTHLTWPSTEILPWIQIDSLNIPVHRDSRVRISLVIPKYDLATYGNDVSGWQSDGIDTYESWQSCWWSVVTTILEPLRKG